MGFFPGIFKPVVDFTGGWKISGTAVTATATELNQLHGTVAPNADGLGMLRVARATYDFAVNGGTIGAIPLAATLPVGALVVGGFIEVLTTCTTAGADAGTMAISVQTANDIVTATAVSAGGDIWDAGKRAIIPKANTPESTSIKISTTAKPITATIAGQNFTAGKFIVFLYYVMGG